MKPLFVGIWYLVLALCVCVCVCVGGLTNFASPSYQKQEGDVLMQLKGHGDWIFGMDVWKNFILSSSKDGTVRKSNTVTLFVPFLWCFYAAQSTGKCVHIMDNHAVVTSFKIFKNFLFAALSDNSIVKWDIEVFYSLMDITEPLLARPVETC